MLQLEALNRRALAAMEAGGALPAAADDAELERAVDAAVARLRAERERAAGAWERVATAIDRRVRTDAVEYMDRDDLPAEEKVRLVRALHRFNRTLLSYHRFLAILKPHVEAVNALTGRPARVLELASGSGEFTLELARLAARRGLPVEVTGSDIVPAYVERGNAEAAARGVPARFVRLNAFEMTGVAPGDHDLVFIAQSAHHFTPGQLARMIRRAHRVASRAFLLVDGFRSLWLLGMLAATGGVAGAVFGAPQFLHDAVVSGRRFFSEPELALIARLAAPAADIDVRTSRPGLSVLTVRRTE